MTPPSKKKKPLGDMRVTRKPTSHAHAGEGHGWAVSYADLLMVLLSFFILYFNFSETTGVGDAQANASRLLFDAAGGATRDPANVQTPDFAVTKLADLLKNEGLRLETKNDRIIVDLDKGEFASGEYAIPTEMKEEVSRVMTLLKPHMDTVNITVIGHTDPRPMRYRNQLLQDNFDLSSVRALTVLKYMLKSGIPGNRASARAASSYDRAARAVSLEVRMVAAESRKGDK